MGANVSASMVDEARGARDLTRLDEVPENCLALVMAYLDPPDVCRIARVNRAFRAASSADFIWEPKLPTNYRFLFDTVFEDSGLLVHELGKRELFAALSRPNFFDGGEKEVFVDKVTGGVHLFISSKGLRITGIYDRRYWNFIATHESRFGKVAYLQQTWWFELEGEIEFQFPTGSYSVHIRLHLGRPTKRMGRRACNVEHVHGWDLKPVKFDLTTSDGQRDSSKRCLGKPGTWVHHRVGTFVVEDPNSVTKIKFSVTQIDCTHTKGGVCVDSVFICPDRVGKSQ